MTTSSIRSLKDKLNLINVRRIKNNMHNYIFIPLIMYCLKQIYNEIICDTQVLDEKLLENYSLKGMIKL